MNTVEQDPLAVPAGGVDTSMPKLMPKLYVLEVFEAKKNVNQESGKESVRMVLKTIQESQSTDGDVVNAGFPLYYYFAHTPTEKYTPADIAKNGAIILKALGLKDVSVRQFIDNPEIVVGKQATVKVDIRKAEGSFPESNVIKQWVEAK